MTSISIAIANPVRIPDYEGILRAVRIIIAFGLLSLAAVGEQRGDCRIRDEYIADDQISHVLTTDDGKFLTTGRQFKECRSN